MLLKTKVREKFKTDEKVVEWYCKFTRARRARLTKLSEQQNHRCCYCGRKTFLSREEQGKESKWLMATIDHIVTQDNGGTDNYYNTVMACDRCNNLRRKTGALKFFEITRNPERLASYVKTCNNISKLTKETKRSKSESETIFRVAYMRYWVPDSRIHFDAIIEEWLNNEIEMKRVQDQLKKIKDFEYRFNDILPTTFQYTPMTYVECFS